MTAQGAAKPEPENRNAPEELFFMAGRSPAEYKEWKELTLPRQLYAKREFFETAGWSTELIESSIKEEVLAKEYLDDVHRKWLEHPVFSHPEPWMFNYQWAASWSDESGTHELIFPKEPKSATTAEEVPAKTINETPVATTEAILKNQRESFGGRPIIGKKTSAIEVQKKINSQTGTEDESFMKAVRRAAQVARKKNLKLPVQIGGSGKDYILVGIGRGGHQGGHMVQELGQAEDRN